MLNLKITLVKLILIYSFCFRNHRSEISKQNMILELRKWAKKDYPIFYVRQIIKRQQELEDLTSKVKRG